MSRHAITRWRSLASTTARRSSSAPWPAIRQWLALPRPRHAVDDRSQPGWSAATFDPAIRRRENVRSVSLLVLDIDDGSPMDRTAAALRGIRAIMVSTRKHTAEHPRYRAVIDVSRPMTVAEHAIIWGWGERTLADHGVTIDPAAKDPSRFWFVPSGTPIVRDIGGEPLDVDLVLALARENAGKQGPNETTHSKVDLTTETSHIPAGQRNAALTSLGGSMRRRGMTESAIRAALMAENQERCDPPLPPAEIEAIARSVSRYARESVAARFELLGAAEIFAPLEPIEWTIESIVPAGSIVEIESYGGSGKSWLAVDAAVAVATGTPWLGRFAAQHGSVAYLDYENGAREMRRRIQADCCARGFDRVEGLALASMPALYLGAAAEAALVAVATGRRLVVVDTLRAACPGTDENDSRMREPIDVLRRAAEQTGCAFVVLVHAKKTSGSVREIDLREAGRGSSAIYDAADVVLHCAYAGGSLTCSCAKSRMGSAFAAFTATIADGEGGAVEVVAADAPTTDEARHQAIDELTDRVLDIVRANPGCSGAWVRDEVGGRPGSTIAALERLERHGALRNLGAVGRGRKAAWYPLGHDGQPEGT